jgi:inosine-uridine nucleoside N-ribohydrolase
VQILFDGDPGIDDALAILTLLREPVDVLAMCAVVGNVPVDTGFQNLRDLAALAGRDDIPVFRGAELPLVRDYVFDPTVHGADGLGGARIPHSAAPWLKEHAAVAAVRLLAEAREPVTWVATGPLTNVALALRLAPGLARKVQRLVVMGGSTLRGNVTPAAEFNVYVDAESWRAVLASGIRPVMVGLNVTHMVGMGDEDFAAAAAIETPVGRAARVMLAYYRNVYLEGDWGEPKLHDVVALLGAISPDLLETRPAFVDVETGSALTYGMTVVDDRAALDRCNCDVAVDVDATTIRRRMLAALRSY